MKNINNYLNKIKNGIENLDIYKLQKIEDVIFNKIKKKKKFLFAVMVALPQSQIIFYVILTKV